MKKTLATIVFGIFVLVLVLPLGTNAQATKLQECCKLRANVKITTGIVSSAIAGCIKDVGGNNRAVGDANPCTGGDGACVFVKDCTLGGTQTTKCALANKAGVIDEVNGVVDISTEMWGLVCLISSVHNVTNWIFYLMLVFVVAMVVLGGATYMTAAGNPDRARKGKNIIIYGIIGLVIALVARLIPSVVKMIVGMV